MIDWGSVAGQPELRQSACGHYRVLKVASIKARGGKVYVPYALIETRNKEGITVSSWQRLDKRKDTYSDAQDVCEQWADNNKKGGSNV